MISKINEIEFLELLATLNKNAKISSNKNSIGSMILKMVSEDGNNKLQGIIFADIYKTQKGEFAKIYGPFISTDFESLNYDQVLIDHLERNVIESFNPDSFICTVKNEEALSFENFGYQIDTAKVNVKNLSKIV